MTGIPAPQNLFVLDILGKLDMHGHDIGGYCLICQRLFSVSMSALIAERGEDCRVRGMKKLVVLADLSSQLPREAHR